MANFDRAEEVFGTHRVLDAHPPDQCADVGPNLRNRLGYLAIFLSTSAISRRVNVLGADIASNTSRKLKFARRTNFPTEFTCERCAFTASYHHRRAYEALSLQCRH